MQGIFEKRKAKYQSVSNVENQINMNIAFDEMVDRILTEKPTAPIQVYVGKITANWDGKTLTITI